MLILADENIPFVREVFGRLGHVRTLPGRAITTEAAREAELLIVRSVTRVNDALLAGSRVRFVGTATIGVDHVDVGALRARGVGFAAAPGSNARSVAEYVAAALLVLESRGRVALRGATLGIVGVGNVGSRVLSVARALGLRALCNDPPRARAEGDAGFAPLQTIAAEADIVTFHVPLDRGGRDPTWHLLDASLLGRLKRGVVVLNTSRGAVHDTAALRAAPATGRLGGLVLDVFEDEPQIDPELVARCDLATPHIAGYSWDGKLAGTRMVFEAACRFLGREVAWPADLPPAERPGPRPQQPSLADALRAAYDIQADDARLRQVVALPTSAERATGFDRLRKAYPRRRELANWEIAGASDVLAEGWAPAR